MKKKLDSRSPPLYSCAMQQMRQANIRGRAPDGRQGWRNRAERFRSIDAANPVSFDRSSPPSLDSDARQRNYLIISAFAVFLGCFSILNIGVATGMRSQLIASVEPEQVSEAQSIGGSLVFVVVFVLTLFELFLLILGRAFTRQMLGVGPSATYDRTWIAAQALVMPIPLYLGIRSFGEQGPPSTSAALTIIAGALILLSGLIIYWSAINLMNVSRLRAIVTFVAGQGITLLFIPFAMT